MSCRFGPKYQLANKLKEINSFKFLEIDYTPAPHEWRFSLKCALKSDLVILHNMSKGSGTNPVSTLVDDQMAGMDHAEIHYFNRYCACPWLSIV